MGKRWFYAMKAENIPKITSWLNKLPKVRWDRIAQKQNHLYIFGWIDREKDSYKDFFVIDFVKGIPVDYCSSDKIYNLEYAKILGLYTQKCRRVEKYCKEVKNVVRLKK